jgi:hypothetical protein
MIKFAAVLSTPITLMAIALVPPSTVLAETPPPGLPPETLASMVNQVSDMLSTSINTGSCQDLSGILAKVPTNGGTPPDPNSLMGQVLLSVKNDPKLKSIVVTKVGPSLITKLIDCNMVPLDALSPSPKSSSSTKP